MISSIYLLKRGVKIDSQDIYGNTPLGCALLYNHPNYAVVLMQNNCDIHSMLFEPDSTKVKVKDYSENMDVDEEMKEMKEARKPIKDMDVDVEEEEYEDEQPVEVEEDEEYDDDDDQSEDYPVKKTAAAPAWNFGLGKTRAGTNFAGGAWNNEMR